MSVNYHEILSALEKVPGEDLQGVAQQLLPEEQFDALYENRTDVPYEILVSRMLGYIASVPEEDAPNKWGRLQTIIEGQQTASAESPE